MADIFPFFAAHQARKTEGQQMAKVQMAIEPLAKLPINEGWIAKQDASAEHKGYVGRIMVTDVRVAYLNAMEAAGATRGEGRPPKGAFERTMAQWYGGRAKQEAQG